jgi:hypothetical protein
MTASDAVRIAWRCDTDWSLRCRSAETPCRSGPPGRPAERAQLRGSEDSYMCEVEVAAAKPG